MLAVIPVFARMTALSRTYQAMHTASILFPSGSVKNAA